MRAKPESPTDDLLVNDPDATPIELDDLQYLKPDITTRKDLNAWEAANIENGLLTARRSRIVRAHLLSVTGILKVHSFMFDKTWTWAGKFRQRSVHFGHHEGVQHWQIISQCGALCADVTAWAEYNTYEWPEIAARLHHKLVLIHPFSNGNGRHSRMMADLLMEQRSQPVPVWGQGNLVLPGDKRREYIDSLWEADHGDMTRLIRFMSG